MDTTFRTKYHHVFHELWGQAVGKPNYNKKDWQALDNMLRDAWSTKNEKRAERVITLARRLRDEQVGSSLP